MGNETVELREKRYKLVKDARAMLDLCEKEKRSITTEENQKYEATMKDVDNLQKDIEEKELQEKRRKETDKLLEDLEKPVTKPLEFGETANIERRVEKRAGEKYNVAFSNYLSATSMPEVTRALQMDLDIAGGYTVVPQQFIAQLIEAVKDITIIRGLSRVFSVPNAESLGAPALDARPADPVWTAEILTGDEDSTMTFGKRELRPHPLAKRIKVSKKLIRASALNVEQIVIDQLRYKIGVVEETAHLIGNGVNQPLGVFTASALGISTSRDVSTGNTATEIKADGLIEAKYSMKSAYWGRAVWIFHRDAIKQIRKLKDGEGQYLWKPGLSNDQGDTILDSRVYSSEYAPNTFTTGLYVGIYGDFSNYWIADALDVTIQVLTELYAESNQNGYIIRLESDGMPVMEEAFARVKLA